jgi:hypothetical protein
MTEMGKSLVRKHLDPKSCAGPTQISLDTNSLMPFSVHQGPNQCLELLISRVSIARRWETFPQLDIVEKKREST